MSVFFFLTVKIVCFSYYSVVNNGKMVDITDIVNEMAFEEAIGNENVWCERVLELHYP